MAAQRVRQGLPPILALIGNPACPEGMLEDGRSFMVDVSYGAPDVDDHTTIEIQ